MKSLLITLSLLFLVTTPYADTEELGGKIFNNNCAVCHGQNASGPKGDWREKLADGSYPPPPLNGTAHTWHHSPKQLLWTINNGGTLIGGKMPAFKDILKEEEKTAVLDYLFSLWPDKIKRVYNERFGINI